LRELRCRILLPFLHSYCIDLPMRLVFLFINIGDDNMTYKTKKIFFLVSAILSLPMLLYLFLLNLYWSDAITWFIDDLLQLRLYFDQDAMIGPIFLSLAILNFNAIVYLVFYRKECHVCTKLGLLFTGTINTLTTTMISSQIHSSWYNNASPTLWYIILCIYAVIALATFIWLIVAMVKYPKPEPKAA